MVPVALGFAAGCGTYLLQPTLPPLWLVATAVAGGTGLAGVLWVAVHRPAALALAASALGFGWSHWSLCPQLCHRFPEALTGADLVAVGRVADLPEPGDPTIRFLFQIESLIQVGTSLEDQAGTQAGPPVPWTGLVRLTWPRTATPWPRAGERWQLPVRLRPPHGFVNPGGFDYEGWLFQRGIQATGAVREPPTLAVRLGGEPGPYWLARWREQVRERLLAATGPGVGGALINALVIGDRSGLTPAQWEVLARTGTSHLLAISGLHVALVAGCGFLLGRWCWARAGPLPLHWPAPRAGALLALATALVYGALAGFAISTQRALVMLAVLFSALLLGRALQPARGLLLALLAVLLLDPRAVLANGFWLSFGAVAVLFYALHGRLHGAPGRGLAAVGATLRGWTSAQWAVGFGLLPLLLLMFGRASLVALPVNLVAVPAFGLVLPLVLAAAAVLLLTGLAWPLAWVSAGLALAYDALAWIAGQPWAALGLGGRPAWVWLAAGAGVALWLAPRGLPGRWVGWLLLLPLLTQAPPAPAPGALAVTVLDVGQGLSVLLRTARHTLVYDTGPGFPSGFNTGSAVVAPVLRHLGSPRVDLVVVSHADQDHSGGLAGLLARVPVARVLTGDPAALEATVALAGPAPPVSRCEAGQAWAWDGVDFTVRHPPADGAFGGNNASCVLQVRAGPRALLLPGDIEAAVERVLVANAGAELASDLLIASHHGSATSTTPEFLAAVRPGLVIFTAGFENRYGFPADSVRKRVAARHIPTLGTADSGAITLLLQPDGQIGGPWRARWQQRRLWRHLPAPPSR